MSKQSKIKLYAKALAEILSKKEGLSAVEEKKIVSNFLKLLTAVGYERRAKEILELTENFLLVKQGKSRVIFETARKITLGQKKLLDGFVEKGDVVEEKINPELIAGVKIIINDSKQFDASMQSKLSRFTRSLEGRQN